LEKGGWEGADAQTSTDLEVGGRLGIAIKKFQLKRGRGGRRRELGRPLKKQLRKIDITPAPNKGTSGSRCATIYLAC